MSQPTRVSRNVIAVQFVRVWVRKRDRNSYVIITDRNSFVIITDERRHTRDTGGERVFSTSRADTQTASLKGLGGAINLAAK